MLGLIQAERRLTHTERVTVRDCVVCVCWLHAITGAQARKDAVHIFHTSMRFAEGGAHPAVAILTARPDLVERIIVGYNMQDVALNYGSMLRDCTHHDTLSRCVRTPGPNRSRTGSSVDWRQTGLQRGKFNKPSKI